MAEGLLGQIEACKRDEIATRFDGVAIDALRRLAQPTSRSLSNTLVQPGSRFVLEVKKASPSAGILRSGADAAKLAQGYAGVADALSVLTDRRYFGGSIDDLKAARRHFEGPILAKDFFIDPRQVVEARIAGADALLVMLSLVDDPTARKLIAEARRFGHFLEGACHEAVDVDCSGIAGVLGRAAAGREIDREESEECFASEHAENLRPPEK